MATKKAKKSSRRSSRLDAFVRTQQINELLERSTIESEALQNIGDDRPEGESHATDLLSESFAKGGGQGERSTRSSRRSARKAAQKRKR